LKTRKTKTDMPAMILDLLPSVREVYWEASYMSKRKICPKCGSNQASKIQYGYPSSEAIEDAIQGKIVLRDYTIPINAPTIACNACEYEWGGDIDRLIEVIIYFKASIEGCFGPIICFEVDNQTGSLTYQVQESIYSSPSVHDRKIATPDTWNQLVKGLQHCDFEYWLDDYRNYSVIDGTHWKVEVNFDDGTVISKGGSNAYPGRWKYFCKMLSKISGHSFQ
jgi:hypothetical protein